MGHLIRIFNETSFCELHGCFLVDDEFRETIDYGERIQHIPGKLDLPNFLEALSSYNP